MEVQKVKNINKIKYKGAAVLFKIDNMLRKIEWTIEFAGDCYDEFKKFNEENPKALRKFISHKVFLNKADDLECARCKSYTDDMIKLYCDEVIIKNIVE